MEAFSAPAILNRSRTIIKNLTEYIKVFFGKEITTDNTSLYDGKWEGFQFIFGSFISKKIMKQMISSSKEKAFFYNLQK